jgi:hypothetical protein
MVQIRFLRVAALLIALAAGIPASGAAENPCDESLTTSIPARAADAPGGHEFARSLRGLNDDQREAAIQRELRAGNIPAFLRRLVPVRLEALDGGVASPVVIICTAPDYLAIGSDADFLLMPMRLATALSVASGFGFTLPTPRMVDAIYSQAAVHLSPQPLPAGSAMRSTDYSVHHNDLIDQQRESLGAHLGALIAGDKKDLVLSNRLRTHPDRVAIYGWHSENGRPIQPLSTVHGWRYADYSHGVRWVSTQLFVDGRRQSIFSSLKDEGLARILSNEGELGDVLDLIRTLIGAGPPAEARF